MLSKPTNIDITVTYEYYCGMKRTEYQQKPSKRLEITE